MPCHLASLQPLAHCLRAHGLALLGGSDAPHDELLALVWGPRFDREHALGLVARQPQHAARALPALLEAADRFDALHASAQRRLRQMILRHRARCAAV